jgi:hypothetical protein
MFEEIGQIMADRGNEVEAATVWNSSAEKRTRFSSYSYRRVLKELLLQNSYEEKRSRLR